MLKAHFSRTIQAALFGMAIAIVPTFPAVAYDIGVEKLDEALDTKALTFMHLVNGAEINMSQMALERSGNQEVLEYAEMLLEEHQVADTKLTELARQLNINLTATLTEDADLQLANAELTRLGAQLSSLQGEAFDQKFIEINIQGHQKVIAVLKKLLPLVQAAPAIEFIRSAIPMLEHHLEQAQNIASEQ